ncbi:hypothetical protein ACR77J_07470 [Tissierella praeacuta]|uniref:hypothetical protein n=1 Tax=Tissierella praeacuta TaxID=43131 RepID=UPI003DA2150E
MRLIDLLETAKKTQDVLVRNDWKIGIIYSEKFNCYMWCDKSGKVIEDKSDWTGCKRVILSPKLLENEKWYLNPNQNKKIERFKELHNKVRRKSYLEKRAEEIINENNINKALEEYYKIGLANAYGHIMYMLDQDFDKNDIKKVIMDVCKDNIQFRDDVFGVWGELYDKN